MDFLYERMTARSGFDSASVGPGFEPATLRSLLDHRVYYKYTFATTITLQIRFFFGWHRELRMDITSNSCLSVLALNYRVIQNTKCF